VATIKFSTPIILSLIACLSRRRKRQLLFVALLSIAAGLAELLTLSLFLPFLLLLASPQRLAEFPFYHEIATQVGWRNPLQALFPLVSLFSLFSLICGLIRLLSLSFTLRLSAAIGSDLSGEAYRRFLFQPYIVHVRKSSNATLNTLTGQTNRSVYAISELLAALTSSTIAFFLLIGLLSLNWALAISISIAMALIYTLIITFSRRLLVSDGHRITQAGIQVIKAIQEGIGSIRDVLLDGNQDIFLDLFRTSDQRKRQLEARQSFVAQSPRYILEPISIISFTTFAAFLVYQKEWNAASAIPILGAFALCTLRLLLALQRTYSGYISYKAYAADLAGVLAQVKQPLPPAVSATHPLPFITEITFKQVSFQYTPELPEVISRLSFRFPAGSRIGLIGTTGSGKSTTVDLLMGLLVPTNGQILIDGMDLHDPNHPELLPSWRASIAHVPQSVYLVDGSFADNIAFGVPPHLVDQHRLLLAAQQAQITDFIDASPDGFETFVGERGIRLSGGQRQRIGIARALYKQARFLIFDEATSALDTDTETSIMDSINNLSSNLTIVIIAHRLTTVKKCDWLLRLSAGRLVAQGPPASLI
jgi:ABC-type multidrug transport system fused ATPase/permease subunit